MESSLELTEVSVNRCFEGYQKVFSHKSKVLKCTMKFGIYLPPALNTDGAKVPVIYWLSGLTCTEQNFITKAGAQQHAAKYGIAVVAPDTSPRGVDIVGQDDSYDFGSGAGFYVDATEEPWNTNYNMYSYITEELPEIINSNFPVIADAQSIMGHSMGGHGALICYLRNPGKYRSVSAFSAICNPIKCPWGKKAFTGYLGLDETKWEQYDATMLVKNCTFPTPYIFIDQGNADDFYKNGQLLPHNFLEACKESNVPVVLNIREGYDHSYFYISTFIEDHFSFHSKYLSASA